MGRFITADTIVQAPYDPQSLNRYSYCRNNPINYTDPTGHKWSWKKFWHAAVGALVGVALGIVLGPAGLAWYGATMSWAIGGAVGGAITGGLEGGWKGALIGGAMGGALGGLGGWASGIKGGGWIIGGMFAAGAGVAGATDSWDSFAGGLTGAAAGWAIGSGINSAFQPKKAEGYNLNRPFNKPPNEQKASDSLKVKQDPIKDGYNKLKSTKWAQTETGKKVTNAVGESIEKGNVSRGNLGPTTRASTDPSTGKIVINNTVQDIQIPGRLAHEGTHLIYGNTPNSLGEERAAFNSGYAVDSELNPSGAWNPSDDWIKERYGF